MFGKIVEISNIFHVCMRPLSLWRLEPVCNLRKMKNLGKSPMTSFTFNFTNLQTLFFSICISFSQDCCHQQGNKKIKIFEEVYFWLDFFILGPTSTHHPFFPWTSKCAWGSPEAAVTSEWKNWAASVTADMTIIKSDTVLKQQHQKRASYSNFNKLLFRRLSNQSGWK